MTRDHVGYYRLVRHWLRGPSVLDLGCGAGDGTEVLGDSPGVHEVLGVDNSYEPVFRAVSRNRSRKLRFVHSPDPTFIPFTSRWTTVVALDALHLWKCPRTALFCARAALTASGALIISLPVAKVPREGQTHHYTPRAARCLISEFFEITLEYPQSNEVTFVASPRKTPATACGGTTVLAMLPTDRDDFGYGSAVGEIIELVRAGMHVVVLCENPQLVRRQSGADAFFFPLDSSFCGGGYVHPLSISAACAFAQWFDVKAIYAADEFMPVAQAVTDLMIVPTVMHLRGLQGAGGNTGGTDPRGILPSSPHCLFVANSESSANHYEMALRLSPGTLPIISSRDFAALSSDVESTVSLDLTVGQIPSREKYGAVAGEIVEVPALAEAAASVASDGSYVPAIDLRKDNWVDYSQLPTLIARTIDKARTPNHRELVVAIASDGFSSIRTSDWVERISLLASHKVRALLVLTTSRDEIEQEFKEAVIHCGRANLLCAAVRRDKNELFSFAREVNRAANYGLSVMPGASGILCANDDTWPSHLALAAVQSWLNRDGLIGGVSPVGGGGRQDRPEFFRHLLDWRARIQQSAHRLSAFWLYVSRQAWVALDGFDEGFEGFGCEDTDLSLRAWQLGLPIAIDCACYVDHEFSPSYSQISDLGALRAKALQKFLIKHGMGPEMYHVPLRLEHRQE